MVGLKKSLPERAWKMLPANEEAIRHGGEIIRKYADGSGFRWVPEERAAAGRSPLFSIWQEGTTRFRLCSFRSSCGISFVRF